MYNVEALIGISRATLLKRERKIAQLCKNLIQTDAVIHLLIIQCLHALCVSKKIHGMM